MLNIDTIRLSDKMTIDGSHYVQKETPPSKLKLCLEVQIGFKVVMVTYTDYMTATDVHDNMANAQRKIDQLVVEAFKEHMK